MTTGIIIIGAGGHGRVLLDALRTDGTAVTGFTDSDARLAGTEIDGIPVMGDDDQVFEFDTDAVLLVNGIGSIGNPERRRKVFERMGAAGYQFKRVAHPGAIVSRGASIGDGAQIMAGAVVQTGSVVGENAIINTGAIVDHDCIFGALAHVAPGATLSGNVRLGAGAHVGAGATVLQGLKLGDNSMIAVGAVVVKNVGDGDTVAGIPAREMK